MSCQCKLGVEGDTSAERMPNCPRAKDGFHCWTCDFLEMPELKLSGKKAPLRTSVETQERFKFLKYIYGFWDDEVDDLIFVLRSSVNLEQLRDNIHEVLRARRITLREGE